MNKSELAKALFEVSHLTGEFLLRSGQTSTEYFDKYQFEAQPNLLQEIAKFMVPMIPHDTEVLGALEMGGIPLATAIAIETGMPMAFIRKEAKDYGTCKLAEGVEVKDKKVCLIEDVITTGGAVIDATTALREKGATVDNVLCVIYRGEGPAQRLVDLKLEYTPLFTMNELKEAAAE